MDNKLSEWFSAQLADNSTLLNVESPQVVNERVDYFKNKYEAGDRLVYAVLNLGKRQERNAAVEIVGINFAKSSENLLDETKFSFAEMSGSVPRFYVI